MNFQIVSWNVRGLNDGSKRLRVRNLLHNWKAVIVCLQETKLEAVSRGTIQSLWRGQYVDWLCLDSLEASGGILIMWDSRVVEKVDKAVGRFSISYRFKGVLSGFEWGFTGVYGPHRDVERRLMWEELAGVGTW
jgi:exonuclease III